MRLIRLLCVLSMLAPLTMAQQGPQSSADAMLDEAVAAYRDADTLVVDAHYTIELKRGRWSTSNEADYRLAYNANPFRLGLEHPLFHLGVDGGRLEMTSDQLPGRHLATSVASPIDYAALEAELPVISSIPLPALVLATADDPWALLLGGPVAEVRKLDADEQGRPQLSVRGGQVEITLTIDPATNLLAHFELARQATMQAGGTARQVETWTFKTMSREASLPADLLAVNVPADSQAFDSFQQLVQSVQAGPDPSAMIGEPVPAIAAPLMDGGAFKLAEMQADVVILDFWTTWCGPCQIALPELQRVADWVKQQNKSVAIYTVNVAEPRQLVQQHWQQMGLTMPVILDKDGSIHTSLQLSGFPATVIIADGKVQNIHEGVSPVPGQYERQLKREIDDLLKQKNAAPSASP